MHIHTRERGSGRKNAAQARLCAMSKESRLPPVRPEMPTNIPIPPTSTPIRGLPPCLHIHSHRRASSTGIIPIPSHTKPFNTLPHPSTSIPLARHSHPSTNIRVPPHSHPSTNIHIPPDADILITTEAELHATSFTPLSRNGRKDCETPRQPANS